DGEVPDGARPVARAAPDRARHGRGVRGHRSDLGAAFRPDPGDRKGRGYPQVGESPGNLPGDRLRGAAMAILQVDDIHTYYGDAYGLQGLSLALEQGQILGLLGRNGVGKTTLVNSIVGFVPPRRGKIVFKGTDVTANTSFDTVRSGMGLVPQGRRVFPTLSVE